MSETLMIWATILLVLFSLIAAVDSFYFHLWKYRLYARPESRYEHRLHTFRAFLFIPIVYFLFYRNFGGFALYLGIFFILLDLIIEILDVLDENQSRVLVGGLSSIEYLIHVLATILRTSFIVLVLAAKPLSAWGFESPVILEEQYSFAGFIALNLIPGNIFAGLLHIWLRREKYQAGSRTLQVRNCCGFSL